MLSSSDWSNRCKQIMKMWRKVSAADKVPYLVSGVWDFLMFAIGMLMAINVL